MEENRDTLTYIFKINGHLVVFRKMLLQHKKQRPLTYQPQYETNYLQTSSCRVTGTQR